ncbi:MAG: adenosine deaminase family protein [Acidobacteriota bacterium]
MARARQKRPTPQELRALPKVELHQHVDGSIPLPLFWTLLERHKLSPVDTIEELERILVMQREEEGTLLAYLDKFHYPLWITQFYENVREVTSAIVTEAYRNGVRVLELRYSPIIHTYAGMTLRQSIRAVLSGMNRACRGRPDLKVGLIVIAMRQHGPHIAKILARQAVSEAQHLHERTGVIGFDIAGPERGNPPKLFREAYEIARLGRLHTTGHAGEEHDPRNVWQAIDDVGLERIGHACAAVKDPKLMKRLARDRVVVECCVSSNYQTGAVKRGERHPIFAFLEAGVRIAICTDNTTVSGTSQLRENRILLDDLPFREIARIHGEARAYTFIEGPGLPAR